ncbi:MAG: carbohydrate ABC transporter permease [Rhodopila sp.]
MPGNWHPRLLRPETRWLAAFILPFAILFAAFAVYPVAFCLWLGADSALYGELFANPRYPTVVLNTVLFAGLGVGLTMLLALLLSGYFTGGGRWRRMILAVFILSWAMPALPAFLSLHWMFIGYGGFMNSMLDHLLGIEGPIWFDNWGLALAINIGAYVWKWLPFWTVILMAGRTGIPKDLYDAAAVDGATMPACFRYITLPLLANLVLLCTILATLWAVGDFTTTYFVSSGAPALTTEVLGTYGFRVGLTEGHPGLGIAAMLTALPVLVLLVAALVRRLRTADIQL